MPISSDKYLNLITQEHRDKPKFVATVNIIAEDYVDIQNVFSQMVNDFDLDLAIGVQLDAVGLWVGVPRVVNIPIDDVYFTWDYSVETGWDNGKWYAVGDPLFESVILNDDDYRSLIRSKIIANNSDGNKNTDYEILDAAFTTIPPILIIDNQDTTMTVQVPQGQTTKTQRGLITQGYIAIKPAGVDLILEIV